MSLIFYDLETSGTTQGFDQILQFAALRTDDDLEQVGDAYEVRSRLLPHVIPAPRALQVTGMTIEQLLDPGRPSHYEMICQIRETVGGWCPGVFVGYNSLRFDEEFLRHAFYQCLHGPYLTNTGGSGRADALALMRAISIIHPDVLTVPISEKGKPTYKLDRLAPANGLMHENAHDALADVEAMVSLCRRVRDAHPHLWRRFLALGHKANVFDFLGEHRAFLVFETAGGQSVANVVVKLGANAGQSSLVYCLDLRCDIDELKGLSEEELAKRLAKTPRPVRRLKANAAPILLGLDEAPARLLGGLTAAEARARAELVLGDPGFVARLIACASAGETVYEPSEHVEQQLYEGGFWSRADQQLMDEFHRTPWEGRVDVAARFQDRRLRILARRLIFFERPELLSEAERQRLADAVARRILDDVEDGRPWLTVPKAIEQADALLAAEEIAEVGRQLLEGYRQHLNGRLVQTEPT